MTHANKLIVSPLSIADRIATYIETVDRRGEYTGYESLEAIYTAKKGYPLFVAGAPHSGKSQLVFQMAVNWAEELSWKGLVYMGEEGSVEDIVMELIWIRCGQDPSSLKRADLLKQIEWVDAHFDVVDPIAANERFFGFEQWSKLAASDGYDFTVLDPWNDMDRDTEVRDDIYLTEVLKKVRQMARKYNRVDIITNHIAKTQHDGKTAGGLPVPKPARAHEWAGGQTWFRRAFTMLLVYRPPAGETVNFIPSALQPPDYDHDEGYKVGPGEVWIENQKAKPKGSGELGWARLYFDRSKHQYFECDERDGRYTLENDRVKRYYASELQHAVDGDRILDNFKEGQPEPAPLTPNMSFLNSRS